MLKNITLYILTTKNLVSVSCKTYILKDCINFCLGENLNSTLITRKINHNTILDGRSCVN